MAPKTIVVKGTGIRQEALANAGITPGHLVELMSTGKVKVHATAGGNVVKTFAVEDDMQGRPIATAYTTGELVQYNHMQPGDFVYGWLKDGQTIVIGDVLESAGDGSVQKHSPDNSAAQNLTNQIVAIAREAVDLSASAVVANARILMEII